LRLVAAQINPGDGGPETVDARRLPWLALDDPRVAVEEAGAVEIVGDYKRELAAAIRAAERDGTGRAFW
jgi:hypothetical protein